MKNIPFICYQWKCVQRQEYHFNDDESDLNEFCLIVRRAIEISANNISGKILNYTTHWVDFVKLVCEFSATDVIISSIFASRQLISVVVCNHKMKIEIYFIEFSIILNIHFGNTWILYALLFPEIRENSHLLVNSSWISKSFNFTDEECVRSFIQQWWTVCTWIESSEWYDYTNTDAEWMKSISLCECEVHKLQLMTVITYFALLSLDF